MNWLRKEVVLAEDSAIKLKEFPFRVPEKMPYTNNVHTKTNNERIRNIACVHCKYQMPSHIYGAMCGVCDHEMVEVI